LLRWQSARIDVVLRLLARGRQVTGVLDRLQKDGFVRRMCHPDDRRKILVTPVPEDAIALYFSEQSEHLAEVLRQRDPAELRVIEAFLADWTGGT
jgi:DNA-binding MarR family transcriptional regulator